MIVFSCAVEISLRGGARETVGCYINILRFVFFVRLLFMRKYGYFGLSAAGAPALLQHQSILCKLYVLTGLAYTCTNVWWLVKYVPRVVRVRSWVLRRSLMSYSLLVARFACMLASGVRRGCALARALL